ncbi:MAG: MFS transporter [Gemmatimonadaceae bacterium]
MTSSRPARSRNPFRLLVEYREFRLFWVGQTISLIGSWMQQVAVGWTALELSDDAFIVGLVAAAGTFPILLLSIPGGVVADRHEKLRIVRIAQAFMLGEAAALWALSVTGHLTIPWLLGLSLIGGVLAAFEIPARQSLMVELVGKEDLAQAIGLNSTGFNLARVMGPSVAAIVVAQLGVSWTFGLNALSYLAVLIALWMIHLAPARRVSRAMAAVPTGPAGFREAWTYIRAHEPLPALLWLTLLFSVLGVPVLSLLPVVARQGLQLGADGYGALMASFGVGAVVGALAIAATGGGERRGRLFRRASYALPVLLMAFAAARIPVLAAVLLFGVGLAMILNNALVNARLQELVPDAVRGRVLSVYVMVYVGASPIGSALGGWVARAAGVDWAIGGGGALMLLVALWAFRRHPLLAAH